MKIQTQTRLLIAGIVAVPLIIFGLQVIIWFFQSKSVSNLPASEDISTLLPEHLSAQEWDSLKHDPRIQVLGDIAIFRSDLLVLYSAFPDYSPGDFATLENIGLFLADRQYEFHSITIGGTHGYILIKFNNRYIATANFNLYILIFFTITLILFALSMSIVIAQNITRSVAVLENATRRIAEGELDLKVDVKGSNEIISLASSLNKLRNTLKEDERRRTRFIMGITHDLKTPLALIKGYAEAIEDGVSDATEIIAAKADQLEEMIDDLIGYVRMETGELRTRLEDTNLPVFLQNCANIMSNDVELLNHTLIHDIQLPENISVPMDERLAFRAFENLIHNAVRHTPNRVTIRLAAVRIENAAGSAVVELTISDNGPGIDAEDLPHIFEMFYRGSSSRREQGMGLGLAVVKWVIDYHGWSISVSAEEGKGTCFTITIPLSEELQNNVNKLKVDKRK